MLILETQRLIIVEEDNENLIACGVYLKNVTTAHETFNVMERIGDVGLSYDDRNRYCFITYSIREKHRKKRYATEALYNLTRFCIQEGFAPYLMIHNSNKASRGVAIKCGYDLNNPHDISTVNNTYAAWTYAKKSN